MKSPSPRAGLDSILSRRLDRILSRLALRVMGPLAMGPLAMGSLAITALALGACTGDTGSSPTGGESATAVEYTVRGVVRQLPDPDRPGSDFVLHHEAVPTFRGLDGDEVGMNAMAMPFPVERRELLDGVELGDKVTIDFTVDWEGPRPLVVTAIEPLPADTRLSFELVDEPAPPGAAPGSPHPHEMDSHEMADEAMADDEMADDVMADDGGSPVESPR